jgi:hypothetical protein
LLAAIRSREGDAGDGPRFCRRRVFWLLFCSQKSDNRGADELMSTYKIKHDVNKWLFKEVLEFAWLLFAPSKGTRKSLFFSYLWLDPKVTKDQGLPKMSKKDSAGYCGDSTRRMSTFMQFPSY